MRPRLGVVVIRDSERVEVENTEGLRAEVLAIADDTRRAYFQSSALR
jgi:hypothetical protein